MIYSRLLVMFLCLFGVVGCASDKCELPNTSLKEAEMARSRGDYVSAIRGYKKALKHESSDAAYVGLGMSLLDTNMVEEANYTFVEAVKKFPKSPGVRCGMGAVYLVINQPEKALVEFDRVLCLDPRCAKALNAKGIAHDLLGKHHKAETNFRAAIDLNPYNVNYKSNLALSLMLSNRPNESIKILERLSFSPKASPRIRQNLSLAYGLVGNYEMARKVGLIDLDNKMVKNNINYFETLRNDQNFSDLISLDQPKHPLSSGRLN